MEMATTDPISKLDPVAPSADAGLLVVVADMTAPQLDNLFANLAASLPEEGLVIATPNDVEAASRSAFQIISAPARSSSTSTALPPTAADFVAAHQLAREKGARAILMLGPESDSLSPAALSTLANAVLGEATDLASPCYELPPRAGLVNSAIFYPLTRALFASRVRFPQAIDLGLSLRMAERLAEAGQRTVSHADALLWPINEAMAAGFVINEFDVGTRALPRPAEAEVNALITQITSSLFADIEAKATYWQRPRRLPPVRRADNETPSVEESSDIGPMMEAFRLAYTNLHEIWSLVLPPNTLLGLKRLSLMDAATFRMPENLWARIIYDFVVAYRLRTINRGHLLGALIPLYMAWVAGHINVTSSGTSAEGHIEAVVAAFEADKPYLVSRWRWPDRFNS